jgi:hypothetical protein
MESLEAFRLGKAIELVAYVFWRDGLGGGTIPATGSERILFVIKVGVVVKQEGHARQAPKRFSFTTRETPILACWTVPLRAIPRRL